jgi:broad specificity phosphatase PhoE
VLVRHGEAECNVNGRVGGPVGCTGLSARGVSQVRALARRLHRTGELTGTTALYASVLPRAIETATLLAPALERWRDGPPLVPVVDCDLCELHPGDADGLGWSEFTERFGEPDWDRDPARAIAPSGESWSGFVERASSGVDRVARAHPGGLVVIACHSGVIEATMARFLPIDPLHPPRNWLRVEHATITEWELAGERWMLRRYNDATPLSAADQQA